MSEQKPSQANSNTRTLSFMIILSVVCALILSIAASVLSGPQARAKEIDRSEQMMIAAKILSNERYFLIQDSKGNYQPAKYTPGGILVPGSKSDYATSEQILEVYNKRVIPFLVDPKGNIQSFKAANVNETAYISEFQKTGYYSLPLKLVYKILPNIKEGASLDPEQTPAEGWVIPVNGFGLWDAIYGYLAIAPNADTVVGITWYQQKETPGLGANIATPEWQSNFPGKLIFQENSKGETDFKTTELGIRVVKGKVSEVLGDSPNAKSAVDGMSGATLTGNGVTDAYKATLAPYRPFLINIHEEYAKSQNGKQEAAS